jgi:hypothetical protein
MSGLSLSPSIIQLQEVRIPAGTPFPIKKKLKIVETQE